MPEARITVHNRLAAVSAASVTFRHDRRGLNMKLTDLQRSGNRRTVYSKGLSDRSGNESYELSIVGPSKLVGQVFEKCDFEIQIDVDVATDAYQTSSKKFFNKYLQADHVSHPEAEAVAGLIGGKLPYGSSTKDTLIVFCSR
jgi:hypothetical protein